MRYLAALVLSLVLAGCGQSVPKATFAQAEHRCQNSEGVKSIYVNGGTENTQVRVICNDTTYVSFRLDQDE